MVFFFQVARNIHHHHRTLRSTHRRVGGQERLNPDGETKPGGLGRLVTVPLVTIPVLAVPLVTVPFITLVTVPLVAVPLPAAPLVTVPSVAIPLLGVPLVTVPVVAVPLVTIPLLAVLLVTVPLAATPLVAVPLVTVPFRKLNLVGLAGSERQGKTGASGQASGSHLDLNRAPYILYGVKYIDRVSLAPFPGPEGSTED